MEITNEIKARVFAQYLGVDYFLSFADAKSFRMPLTPATLAYVMAEKGGVKRDVIVVLRPLLTITDEEKEECFITRANIDFPYSTLTGKQTDQLRAIGVDLPNYLLGEKTLKEAGLAIYE